MKQLLLPLVALALAGAVSHGLAHVEYVDPATGAQGFMLGRHHRRH